MNGETDYTRYAQAQNQYVSPGFQGYGYNRCVTSMLAQIQAACSDAPSDTFVVTERDTSPEGVQGRIDEVAKDIWGRHTSQEQRDKLRKGIDHVDRVPASSDQAFGNILGRKT